MKRPPYLEFKLARRPFAGAGNDPQSSEMADLVNEANRQIG